MSVLPLLAVGWLSIVVTMLPAVTLTASVPSGDDLDTKDHEEITVIDRAELPFLLDIGVIPRTPWDQSPFDIVNTAKREVDAELVNNVGSSSKDALGDRTSSHLKFVDDGPIKVPTDLETVVRRTRQESVTEHRTRKSGGDCRRHDLHVNFTSLGWSEKLVSPEVFNAYYCDGDCPAVIPAHITSTNHAWIQNYLHSLNSGLVPKACCVPTAFSDMNLIVINREHEPVAIEYKDVIVEECGCR